MKRIVTYGEAMIRLTAPMGVPLDTATNFTGPVGGAELNVAIAARREGLDATWVSTLPDGPLGDLVARHAKGHGVSGLLRRCPGRLGLYFFEQAVHPRSSRIIYDRSHTAFVEHPRPEFAWSEIIDEDTILALSGITPALGAKARMAVEEAIDAARSVGATVAFDVNYRASLWTIEDAFSWLKEVIDRVDVLSAGPRDLRRLGVNADDDQAYRDAAETLDLTAVIGTDKKVEGRRASITVHAATRSESTNSEVTAEILDPVGAGDALFGTFLAGLGDRSLDENTTLSAGALVTAYGVVGDALTADPWTPDQLRGVRR